MSDEQLIDALSLAALTAYERELLGALAGRLFRRAEMRDTVLDRLLEAGAAVDEGQLRLEVSRLEKLLLSYLADETFILTRPRRVSAADPEFAEWQSSNPGGLVVDEQELVLHRALCGELPRDALLAAFAREDDLDFWLETRRIQVTPCRGCRPRPSPGLSGRTPRFRSSSHDWSPAA